MSSFCSTHLCRQTIIRVTSDLEDIVPWRHVGDVHPLAVDVVAVRIPAAHSDALIAHVVAGVPFGQACCRGDKAKFN